MTAHKFMTDYHSKDGVMVGKLNEVRCLNGKSIRPSAPELQRRNGCEEVEKARNRARYGGRKGQARRVWWTCGVFSNSLFFTQLFHYDNTECERDKFSTVA